ncbi:MAG: hypothetical protein AAF517_18965, partial [Planctomycetota bacterium]
QGRVIDIEVENASRAQVVEQVWVTGRVEPISFPPYRLAAGGRFQSRRQLRSVERVRVSVITPSEWGADAFVQREGAPDFRVGELRLQRTSYGIFKFQSSTGNQVAPPTFVGIRSNGGRAELTRLRLDRLGSLRVDNLRRGNYEIVWKGEGTEESFPFEVKRESGARVEGTVPMKSRGTESVIVQVVDSKGNPVRSRVAPTGPQGTSGVAESLAANLPRGPNQLEPGLISLPVRVGKDNGFRISAPGFLPTQLQVGPREQVPSPIRVYRGASLEAKVVDADGFAAEGEIQVSWNPVEPSPFSYGEPKRVQIRRGRIEVGDLPPVRGRFKFQLVGSDIAVVRTLTLPEAGDMVDIGKIRLEETRVLTGVVRHRNGAGVSKAQVFLVERQKAYRYPLREPVRFETVEFRTETDDQGTFRLEGLPIDLSPNLSLVAHLDGQTDAIEFPVDYELESHQLVLGPEAELHFEAGYRDETTDIRQYRFSLSFLDPDQDDRVVQLGEIHPDLLGFHRFIGIRPGRYRITWGLRDGYDPLPPLWEEVFVEEGTRSELNLVLEGRVLRGQASFNHRPLAKGWILITDAPGEEGATRVGRVENGQYVIVDPPQGAVAFGAVIPDNGKTIPVQNIARGESLPIQIAGYGRGAARGVVNFNYEAYDVTIRLGPDFRTRYPGAYVQFPHYEFRRGRIRTFVDKEELNEPTYVLRSLRPGTYRFVLRTDRDTLIMNQAVILKDRSKSIEMR